ncbi:MAG: hypothetical protein FWG88_07025 [Oscillospiraceae bacterium]|nr:hypothetical protein [Oscillospiraceae bacterium]
MRTVDNAIEQLEEMGLVFQLAVDYEYRGDRNDEIDALIATLANDREAVLDNLLARRFVPLPDDLLLPPEWVLNAAMKQFILDAGEDLLDCIVKGHSALWVLLWAFRALCFL